MARWRQVSPPRIEPPAWYRTFDLAAWDEPDGHELGMIAGCAGYHCWPGSEPSRWRGWPQWLHVEHARRRWHEAQHEYRKTHEALAEQEFDDLVNKPYGRAI